MNSRLRCPPNESPFIVFCLCSEDEKVPIYIYPENFESNDIQLDKIHGFCFPCDSIKRKDDEFFVFVLTDKENKLAFGFSLYDTKTSKVFCVLSHLPWQLLFSHVLTSLQAVYVEDNLDDLAARVSSTLNQTTEQLYETWKHITLHSQIEDSNLFNALAVIPSDKDFTIFASIGWKNMVIVFQLLMNEQRILFVSNRLSYLSACCLSCLRIMYPFFWQSVFVPILPYHLHHFIEAPYPYIIGVHLEIWKEIQKHSHISDLLKSVVVIHLDETNVKDMLKNALSIDPALKNLSNNLRNSFNKSTFCTSIHESFLQETCKISVSLRNYEKLSNNNSRKLKKMKGSFVNKCADTLIFQQFVGDKSVSAVFNTLLENAPRHTPIEKNFKHQLKKRMKFVCCCF
ncbi:hypothetical protein GJ496_000393 [Pomphorhynchus laevis]|nr:hypothetical protein GJ496_000393 [Pomphorhynchus laevis]